MEQKRGHYNIFGTVDELRLSGAVATNVELVDVFLTEAKGRFLGSVTLGDSSGSFGIDFGLEDAVIRERSTAVLVVDSAARLTIRKLVVVSQDDGNAHTADIGDGLPWLDLRLVTTAVYALPGGQIPKEIGEEGLGTFARLNGAYHCWPFMREQMERMAWQMGRVQVMLPLLFVKQKPNTDSPVSGKRES